MTETVSKSILPILILALCFTASTKAWAIDFVEPEGKTWEYTLGLGYKDFATKGIDSSPYVAFRIQKRIVYPFLVGLGADATLMNNIIYAELHAPVSLRIPIKGRLKLDAIVAPGGAYARNSRSRISRIIATGMGGAELKFFIKKSVSLGVGGYYAGCSDSRFNNIKVGLIAGF
jgi:hypothetical protein